VGAVLPCAPLGAAVLPLEHMAAATLLQNKLWAFLLGAGTAGAAYASTRVRRSCSCLRCKLALQGPQTF